MLNELEKDSTITGQQVLRKTSVLDAIYWLHSAWTNVTDATIQKCYTNSGFNAHTHEAEGDYDDEDNIPLSVLQLSTEIYGKAFNELHKLDDKLPTSKDSVDWDKPVLSNSPILFNEIQYFCTSSLHAC